MHATIASPHGGAAARINSMQSHGVGQELRALMPAGALKRLSAKEHLFLEGDARKFVFDVLSGAIALYKIMPDGRRQILRFALPGDFVGLDWSEAENVSAQASGESVVRCIPITGFRRALEENPMARRQCAQALTQELIEAREHLATICAGDATQRVAFLLKRILERAGREEGRPLAFELPMTRLDMGDYLGLTLETVSRELSRLKALGIITIERITRITIRNRQAFLDLASCESRTQEGRL